MAYSSSVRFEWSHDKSLANKRKHGVTFKEAEELFRSGQDYLELFDETHDELEDRFIAIGPIRRGLVLVVWTERAEDVVRIISARWATPQEKVLFLKHMSEDR